MSTFNRDLFDKLTALSRLKMTTEEQESLYQSLIAVVGCLDHLSSVDTEGLSPTYSVIKDHKMELREDIPAGSTPHSEYMQNAPKVVAGMISVPHILH